MEQLTPTIFTSVIDSYLPEPHASLLNGMLFGINLKTSKVFYEQLKAVGLLHIVVLSGMNITLLASTITIATSFFGKLISSLITILTIIMFIIFVGAKAPIVRAGFMGILTLVALLYGRRKHTIYILFLSTLFIFIFWPTWIKTISFQLSYGSTLGIILFGQSRERQTNNILENLLDWAAKEIKLSLAAQLFTAPLIFLYFKQVSLVSPISNLLVSFTIAPIMIFGFLTAILGRVNYSLGLVSGYICYGLLSYVVFVVETLSRIPIGYFKF
ncbi:ComEC/Rec2 family competence protein [Candidatus Roizmanbacteria bacterium]|nr:ComEC/Rec2 family competence protein [Candidatus Roizmanbacteria bacterium]